MKKNISALVILISLIASAQNTTIIEQYCDMVVTNAPFSRKLNITLGFGQERPKRFKDAKLKDDETGKPKQFNTVIDALNYIGVQGWSLVNAFSFPIRDSCIYHYYLRKRFKRHEIVD